MMIGATSLYRYLVMITTLALLLVLGQSCCTALAASHPTTRQNHRIKNESRKIKPFSFVRNRLFGNSDNRTPTVGGMASGGISRKKTPWRQKTFDLQEQLDNAVEKEQMTTTETKSSTTAISNEVQKKKKSVLLSFQGQVSKEWYLSSSLMPRKECWNQLLQDPKQSQLFLKGGGHPVSQTTMPSPPSDGEAMSDDTEEERLLSIWKTEAKRLGTQPPPSLSKEQTKKQQRSSLPSWIIRKREPSSFLASKSCVSSKNRSSIVSIQSTVPLLPGLSVQAVSVMGCQLVRKEQPEQLHPQTVHGGDSTTRPYTQEESDEDGEDDTLLLECTLLDESYQSHGTKAMKWLFDMVVAPKTKNRQGTNKDLEVPNQQQSNGMGEQDNDGSSPSLAEAMTQDRKTHSMMRFSISKTKQKNGAPFDRSRSRSSKNNDDDWQVQYTGQVHVDCRLPRRLIKLLPMSQQRVEAKVSKAIQKQILDEGEKSFQKLREHLEAGVLVKQRQTQTQEQDAKAAEPQPRS